MKLNKKDNPIMIGTIDGFKWIYVNVSFCRNIVLLYSGMHNGWNSRFPEVELPAHDDFQGWNGSQQNTRPTTMQEQARFLKAYPVLRTIYWTTKTCR